MTTNKPEVMAWYTPATRYTLPVVALDDRSQRGEPLIHLSDYEALQAECEKLRSAMIEAKSHIGHYMYGGSGRGLAAKAIAIIDAAMEKNQ